MIDSFAPQDATYCARLRRLVHRFEDPLLLAGAEAAPLRFRGFGHHMRIGDRRRRLAAIRHRGVSPGGKRLIRVR